MLAASPPTSPALSAIAEEAASSSRSSSHAAAPATAAAVPRRQHTLHVDLLGDEVSTGDQRRVAWRRALAVLLWKNWLLLWKRRNGFATALEVLLPVACAVLLGVARLSSPELFTPTTGWGEFSTDASAAAVSNTSFNNKVIVAQETSVTGLLLHLSSKAARDAGRAGLQRQSDATLDCVNGLLQDGRVATASAPNAPPPLYAFPPECRGLAVPYRIALVPDNAFTREYFTATVTRWYPRTALRVQALQGPSLWNRTMRNQTLLAPSFEESVAFFSSEAALEAHVRAADYGSSAARPKIYAALVFHRHPQRAWFGNASAGVGAVRYSIRLSASAGDAVPTLKHEVWEPALRSSSGSASYATYAVDGFLTLQSLVTRFLACQPQWNESRRSTNGSCVNHRVPSTSSSAAPALERQFLRALGNDVLINDALANFDWTGGYPLQSPPSGSVAPLKHSFANYVLRQSDRVTGILLGPLRQLPSPHVSGRYLPMVTESASVRLFYTQLGDYVALLLGASYIYAVAKMISTFISERETRSREFLQVFSVRERFVWASWYITYGVLLAVGAALVTAAFKLFGVFSGCSTALLLALLCLFAWSLLSGAFVVSAVFSSTRLGAFVGAFLVLAVLTLHERLLANSPRASYVLSQLVLAKALRVLMTTEQTRAGPIGFGNLNAKIGGERLSYCLGALLLHCVGYTLTALYLERVLPRSEVVPGTGGERAFRSREVWYFPLLPSFWKGRPAPTASSGKLTAGVPAVLPGAARSDSGDAEPTLQHCESSDMAMLAASSSSWSESFMLSNASVAAPGSLHIQRNQPLQAGDTANALCLFRVSVAVPTVGSQKEVLDGINLALPVGKITSVVGAPGAGKSALMSVLQMRTPLVAGDVGFDALSWKVDVRRLRKMMGFCFQTDVLFPELTVLDHLTFFAKLKRFPSAAERDREIRRRLNDFGLAHRRTAKVKSLSAASRRKLTLAIALLRDERSKFLFLDEPTRGMDPYTRTQTWEILRRQAEDRVVVVATSDIVEAVAVGDHVAVLANGKLQYAGAPRHLEASARVGYLLALDKGDAFREREVLDLVWSSLKTEATVVVNSDRSFVLRIPMRQSPVSSFAALFQKLETQSARELGVKAHRLTLVRLEDAFGSASTALTRSPSQSSDDERASASIAVPPERETWLERPHKQGWERVRTQASGVVMQRLQGMAVNWAGTLLEVLSPAVFLVACMAIVGSLERTFDHPVFALTPHRLAEELPSGSHVNVAYSCVDSATGAVRASELCRRLFNASRWEETTPVALNWTLSAAGNTASVRLDAARNDYLPDGDSANVLRSNATSAALDDDASPRRFSEVLFNRRFYDASPTGANFFGGFVLYTDAAGRVLRYDLFLNSTVPHASGIFRAQFDDALLREFTGDSVATLEVINHPLPQTAQARRVAIATQQGVTVNAFLVVLALTYFPATVVERLVGQRSRGAGNATFSSFLAGVHPAVYWASHYAVDFVLQLLSCALVLVVIVVCDIATWTGTARTAEGEAAGSHANPLHAVVVLLFLFACASCSAAYAAALCFRSRERWFLTTRTKAGLAFASTALATFAVAGEALRAHPAAQEVLATLLGFSPFFSLCYGLHRLAYAQGSASTRAALVLLSPFDPAVAGISALFLGATAALWFAAVVVVESLLTFPDMRWAVARIAREERASVAADSEVASADPSVGLERERVASQLQPHRQHGSTGAGARDAVLVHDVSRIFRAPALGSSVYAPVSFGVARGECFALLGVAGSGKSTLLRFLTGEVLPSTGRVLLDGLDATEGHAAVRQAQRIGYCAQESWSLQPRLRVREQLLYRARLKGVGTDTASIAAVADQALDALALQAARHRLVGSLERAEKRKLSLAMALLGRPPVVCALVVATASLAECAAVSSKVGIVHEGALAFVGRYEALHRQFEYGWLLDVRFGAVPRTGAGAAALMKTTSSSPDASEDAEVPPVTRESLRAACEAMGHGEWVDRVHATHPTGSWLALLLALDGQVSASTFRAWGDHEAHFEALAATLGRVFGAENTSVLRRGVDTCRFQLTLEDSELRLSQVFKVLESARSRGVLADFAVAPSTFQEVLATFAQSAAAKWQLRDAGEARARG
ncbi:hypothetical protein PybrP1_001496 [[Pythium] brassicae (nom. inval.)]|nr:hypothetical protein PybrP1_001496 [[Pythium] brassicae (nom. inval.)]